jgi:tetratricopeptide (TPR) repeat protein
MSRIVPLLKFTPSAQDPQVLETITVQREPLITNLVEAALDTGGGARHQLLIGPRGIGKTHIFSVVASRVRAGASSSSITLAWLEEDPWSIGSYEKFLAAIVSRVAAENADETLVEKADELHASRDKSGREGEQMLRDAVGGSRLVLLVENLDDVFHRIGDNGEERLRAFIEDWQQMLVLATAPQLFEGVQLHKSPFYGFFAITHLDELDLDSATELMRRVAKLRGDNELVEFLGTDVASRRLEAVEALAGGHPRIWLLLSGCVSIKAIDELVPLFLEALDDLTPYYQDRLRELGHQQQELVAQLSEAGGALSNRALAERSGIAQNQVATILRQLTDRGYVRRAEVSNEIATGDARMSFWELREPLMRLCLDVKQARGKPLRMVVEFLRSWYGPRLLDELAALPPSARLATTYVSEALRTLEGALPADALLRGSPSEILARAELGLSAAPDRPDLRMARATGLLLEDRFSDALDALEAMIAVEESEQGRLAVQLQLVHAKRGLGEPIDSDPLVEGLLKLSKNEPDSANAQDLVVFGLTDLDRHEEALEAFPRALELESENARLFGAYGRSLVATNHYEEALEAFDAAARLEPDNTWIHASRGAVLRWLGRSEDVLVAVDKALELEPDNAEYQRLKGSALVDLGRHEEALEAFAKGSEIDPDDALMHGGRAAALLGLGRGEEAVSATGEGIELDPGSAPLLQIQGMLLAGLNRLEEALVAFRRVAEIEPSNAESFNHQANLLRRLGRLDEAEQAVRRAIDLDDQDVVYRFTLSEISFARVDADNAVRQLREALSIWSQARETAAGEPELLCRILAETWSAGDLRRGTIDQIIEAFDEVDAGDVLGRGLVSSIAWLADPEVNTEMADLWVEDWLEAREVGDLQIPRRLLRAANAWKKDRDQAHLLDLPPEQRKILIDLLGSQK